MLPALETSTGGHPAAGSNLEEGAITANLAIFHAGFDSEFNARTKERRELHERIGLAAPVGSTTRSWHLSRADGLRRPLRLTTGQCGSRGQALGCGCPSGSGSGRKVVRRGCHRRLYCEICGDEYRRATYQRVRRSVLWWMERLQGEFAARGGKAAGRRQPRTYLVTLTIPHLAHHSVEDRARALDVAWRYVSRGRVDGHWTRPCLAVWEWTPGSDGRGHPHLHVVVPSHYLDYPLVWGEWGDACEVAGLPRGRVHISPPPRQSGRDAAARQAAAYVSKYVSSTEKMRMTAEQWAQLGALMSGRRTLRASVGSRSRGLPGFWQAYERPRCQCCGDTFSLLPVRHQWTGSAFCPEPLDESVSPVIPTTISYFAVGIMDSLRCQ